MNTNRIDVPMLLLFAGTLIYTGILLAIAKAFPNDGQTFMVISTILGNFSGALFMRINPKRADDPHKPDQAASGTVSVEGGTPTATINVGGEAK